MISGVINTASKIIRPFAFSSLKPQASSTLKSGAYGGVPKQAYMTKDAQKVFQQFFQENPPKDSEKALFGMGNRNQQETQKIDPFEVLGIQKNATKEQIKQAYRELALKYHPKRDPTMVAAEKFVNICQAYDMLKEKKSVVSGGSFASQFQQNMKELLNSEIGISKQGNFTKSKILTAELYTETVNKKKIEGTQEVILEKEYNKNGKLIKFVRVEKAKQDGKVQVSEIFDDGEDTKTISYNTDSFANKFEEMLYSDSKLTTKSNNSAKILNAELYSQTKNVKKIGNIQEVKIEKEYNKNGKLIHFTRIQKTNENGQVEVSETFDDGAQMKVVNYK